MAEPGGEKDSQASRASDMPVFPRKTAIRAGAAVAAGKHPVFVEEYCLRGAGEAGESFLPFGSVIPLRNRLSWCGIR